MGSLWLAPVSLNTALPAGPSPEAPHDLPVSLPACAQVAWLAEARPAMAKHLGGLQQRLKIFRPLLVPLSALLPELLSRACGWRGEATLSRHRCRRACPSHAQPRARSGTRQPGLAAPAGAVGCVRAGVSYPNTFSPSALRGARLRLGTPAQGRRLPAVHGNLATCAGRSREGAVLPLQKETQLSKMFNEHYK